MATRVMVANLESKENPGVVDSLVWKDVVEMTVVKVSRVMLDLRETPVEKVELASQVNPDDLDERAELEIRAFRVIEVALVTKVHLVSM